MTKTMQAFITKISVPKKSKIPVSLRKLRDEVHYGVVKRSGRTRPLLEEYRLREWENWAIIKNDFPYSAAFDVHHMLIPKRRVSERELYESEREELKQVLDAISEDYDCMLVNFKTKQSIRDHYHIHLLVYKTNREELKF
jgi:diadenosine tetraphosphate (Ap4A) HIT family hydrolase